jgi:pyruvate dehydrogenase E2 component (dihydrolipoamide acetyltransferase)
MDLRVIRGSGPGGRILEQDVLRAVGQAKGSGATPMRRAIARMTQESFATIPHFYLHAEVDASRLLDILRQFSQTTQVRVNLTDLLLWAQALALAECPHMNVLWVEDSLRQLDTIAIGLVVSVPSGIQVPVLKAPHELDLPAVAALRARLVEQCRSGHMPPESCVGAIAAGESATSLSNLGRGRVDRFLPVIHLRQSSMLAVGRLAERPWVVNHELAVRPTLQLTMAVDHRACDGAPAAQYLEVLCRHLESPGPWSTRAGAT